jgi:hypothetical protein
MELGGRAVFAYRRLMPWQCFYVTQTSLETRHLRVSETGSCPGIYRDWHNAEIGIEGGRVTYSSRLSDDGEHRYYGQPDPAGYDSDARWPVKCDYCEHAFGPDATRHVHSDPVYQAAGGRCWPMRELPIGAMLDAWWRRHDGQNVGEDGISLHVKLPPGGPYDWWTVDAPASDGGRWTRTGTVPLVSASPSINSSDYHGWLGTGSAPGPGWLSDPI